jgi:hypothetical protein
VHPSRSEHVIPYLEWVRGEAIRRSKLAFDDLVNQFNARRVLAGVELVQKIIKGQFQVPEKFGIAPVEVWHNVLAA